MGQNEKKRSGCLTVFLILMLIANALVTLLYIFGTFFVRQTLPNYPAWGIPILTILCILNIVFAVAVFKWKKWGVYGFGANSIIAFSINLITGVPFFSALIGFLGIIILVLLVRPVWNCLE